MERKLYSRREFLYFLSLPFVSSLVPDDSQQFNKQTSIQSAISDGSSGFQHHAEDEITSGRLRVIDATGIDCDEETVDVLVNPDLIKASILARASQMISAEYLPKVEEQVNKLVISFGARGYEEVLSLALKKSMPSEEGSLRITLIRLFMSLLNLGISPIGFYLRGEHPLMYFNTSQILKSNKTTFREVWDHEVAHLIYMTDPATRDSIMNHAMKYVAVHASLLLTTCASATAVNTKLFANIEGMSMEAYVRKNRKSIVKRFIRLCEIMNLPTVFLSHGTHYQYFDKDEQLARESEERFPTPDDEFEEMIQVVPRENSDLDASRLRG